MKRSRLMACTAWVAATAILNPIGLAHATVAVNPYAVPAAGTNSYGEPLQTIATSTGTAGAANANPGETSMSLANKIALLRQKVKYVFVLFQENRSYDHYFGSYPGANGILSTYPGAVSADIYSQPATSFSSYYSVIRDITGNYITISPFLIPRTIVNQAGATVQLYPEDIYSVDHSHGGYVNDMHADSATKTIAQNDGYALDQEGLHYATDASGTSATIYNSSNIAPTANPNLQTKQKGEVVMAHVDCDTIPFLWQYADRFAMFDNFHQTATGPSSPNAVAMIAAQTGDTQWVRHPSEGDPTGLNLPMLTDSHPYPGSLQDVSAGAKPPYGPDDASNSGIQTSTYVGNASSAFPLTFASLPLSFMGNQIGTIIRQDENPAVDLADVGNDIAAIAVKNPHISWGWYQQGYGPEPFDGTAIFEDTGAGLPVPSSGGSPHVTGGGFSAAPAHASYIVHHNGPQYFGYLGDNPAEQANMHGLQQFYTDVANQALPANGGVFYVRGGYYNNDKLLPADPNPIVEDEFAGNDDHGSYSDSQISEAMVADSINAIASSPYWRQSAIIVTYDESDGFYDHQPEQFRSWGPDHQPETGGPRIPAIVISPYAAAHTVSHVYSEHSSVIKFINELFNLVPLQNLPNEAAARVAGAANSAFNAPSGAPQTNLGPADAMPGMGDLLEAFDNDRLTGSKPVLPASYAMIDPSLVKSLPHYVGQDSQGNPTYGCQYLHITPTDYPGAGTPTGYTVGGYLSVAAPPQDFNPRPTVSNGNPYLNTNNNTGGASTGPWPN